MARMTITIDLDSFEDRPHEAHNVSLALHELAYHCRVQGDLDFVDARRLQDTNGNAIGGVTVIRREEAPSKEEEALAWLFREIEDREDVRDGSEGPMPNEWMSLLVSLEQNHPKVAAKLRGLSV